MNLKIVQFLAIMVTAIALMPGMAHLLELANKMQLDRDQYFIVQRIYAGWALLGIALIAAVLVNLLLAIITWGDHPASELALAAAILVGVTLVIFFLWTYPENQATSNWTAIPDDWTGARARWEYSHAANAVLMLIAFGMVTLSVVLSRR